MKTYLRTTNLVFLLGLLFLNTQCDEDISCDDCLELDPKVIEIVDEEGNNLLLGASAIYDPGTIKIFAADDYEIAVFFNVENGTLEFALAPSFEDYELVLTETESDFISFETDLRPSEYCCGNVRFSTSTFLNNIEIANEELITIIKD